MTKIEEFCIKIFSFFFSCFKYILGYLTLIIQKKSSSAIFEEKKSFVKFYIFNYQTGIFSKANLVLTKNEESFIKFFSYFFAVLNVFLGCLTFINKKKFFSNF